MKKKILTIVGMGPGVSSSVAKIFGKDGFEIAMIARNKERLTNYENDFKSQGIISKGFNADVSDESSLRKAFSEITEAMGNTDVLNYNAFSMRTAKPMELKLEDCINDFKINVAGALLCSQLVIPSMIEKKSGSIFFTGGILGVEPMPLYTSLGIGKAGLRNLCYSLYKELKPANIHAAMVTITGFVKPGTKWDPDKIAEEFFKLYLQKPGEFEKEIMI